MSKRRRSSWGLPKAYGQPRRSSWPDSSVQSVHLAVLNVLHYEFAKRVIAAGKHVICEKPLAMSSAQSAELVELGRPEENWPPAVCYNIRFLSLNLEARDRTLRARWDASFPSMAATRKTGCSYDTDYNWRVLAEQGGALPRRGRHRHH